MAPSMSHEGFKMCAFFAKKYGAESQSIKVKAQRRQHIR